MFHAMDLFSLGSIISGNLGFNSSLKKIQNFNALAFTSNKVSAWRIKNDSSVLHATPESVLLRKSM